jgi:hypothetical protein
MLWRCRSRWLGALSTSLLSTAVDRGGTINGSLRMALNDSVVDTRLIVGSITGEGSKWACDLIEQGPSL